MNERRLFGVDLLRFTAMIAIIHFHTHEFFFYDDNHLLRGQSLLNTWLEHYSRFMSFSGFTIIILSFFLFGYRKLSAAKWKKMFTVCVLGIVVLLVNSYEGQFYFEWDIYSYVIASLITVGLLQLHTKILYFFASLSFVALCLQRSIYLGWNVDPWLKNALVGDYQNLGAGSWPMIPWLGLAVLFYSLGLFIKENNYQKKLSVFERKEVILWVLLLTASLPQIGAYYEVPIGPNFYNFVFNRGTLQFWSHIIWVLFIIRLSFCQVWNSWANNNKYLNWISRLQMNQRFFLFYFLQLFLIGVCANFSEFFRTSPWWIDVYLLLFIPVTELCCVGLVRLTDLVKFKVGVLR